MSSGTMERILRLMAEKKASDVYLSAHAPAMIKINGQTLPINSQVMPPEAPLNLLSEIVPATRIEELRDTGELNMAVPLEGVGNFRISAMRQRSTYAVCLRYVPGDVPSLDSLNVPPVLSDLVMEKRGLVLMVGATGAGKTTTLAAMIDLRNELNTGHILTIEDPIEYVYRNKKSVVNQREIGPDTASLQVGLKNALRQAPDVILIGEIRDRETMSAAIAYAQSGHLCLATLHANNSYQALNRILSFYPVEVRPTMLGDLAAALRAIVSQRLLRTHTGGRVPAVEVMLNTALIADLIQKADFSGVREAMEKSLAVGSQSFEQDLARLVRDGIVSRNEGLAHADSPNNLLWRLQNDFNASKSNLDAKPSDDDQSDNATFTEFSLDVKF
ncbi:MAG TPA: type IV pili twitching motility protein PilT [Hydrogenophaga sp.]|jgi:twitching motility protein PilU|uniref:PilT/PilU family type 4a pilus ATPase n=1 Tax=Hydrogenophaga aromaticivorans TaxID=2610898 RepID=A0A7Y8KXA2_9BURK|nr:MULTISPECIES: PilT/PilU family type 4a pilus ATPase [Hydrogenophaga]MBU4182919.1 PilT/PilU family type 4a pilus ATPase [Gammaproteobacteria bacterium]OGA78995.1 MAG: type IV pili twitching motility protein PilT [Burkholderiales bacterium GWE1_65_30]OGA91885.1 MAG: type IV pili twitching motility protein PilT [Burkholderiales bacterium GWF1_66_17]OGB12593.1 MAG: type IV pili twitching motility protein PilT [Burkholderiales bacterium RIFCSPHIGHO2_02_FULL_66_10]OGB34149.1 MAG: type IV pili twi